MAIKRSAPSRVLILGGGTAGWMAASWIKRWWPESKIQVVESQELGTIGVGEGTTPSMRNFFRELGISEEEWMPHCNATYKVGISFPGWSDLSGYESYFHPFFTHLDSLYGGRFFDDVKQRRSGHPINVHPDNYFVTTAMARAKYGPIPKRKMELEPDYAYHFDSNLLGDFLRKRAIKLGVERIVDTIEDVLISESGDVSCLKGSKHGEYCADFYIDCTGFKGLLIEKSLKEKFRVFNNNLFNDSAVAIATEHSNVKDLPVETQSKALKFGWTWKIPLTKRNGNGYVYSSEFISPDMAERELAAELGIKPGEYTAKHIKMKVGRVERHWRNNCLALGLSQGFIEPLEATALMLVHYTLSTFTELYSKSESLIKARSSLNLKVNNMFDGVRDYIVAHYFLNTRSDTEYWIANRSHDHISDNLRCLLSAWDGGESFEVAYNSVKSSQVYTMASWYCLLVGMGRLPATKEKLYLPETSLQARQYAESAVERLFSNHIDCVNELNKNIQR